jgi:hypothetical protein
MASCEPAANGQSPKLTISLSIAWKPPLTRAALRRLVIRTNWADRELGHSGICERPSVHSFVHHSDGKQPLRFKALKSLLFFDELP